MRSPSSSRPWPARPTSWSPGPARPSPLHDAREYDAVVASGEQVTSGLLAIALQDIGVNARSWQGWQIPIRTDSAHGAARIAEIDGGRADRAPRPRARSRSSPASRASAPDNRITTLGRGGSDTSAVAIAAAIEAPTAATSTPTSTASTPPIRASCRRRKRLAKVSYEEMLEMASLGAKVLQVRSVELAMVHGVRTLVRSSFDDAGRASNRRRRSARHAHLRRG